MRKDLSNQYEALCELSKTHYARFSMLCHILIPYFVHLSVKATELPILSAVSLPSG
jgi:hypothetical protein